MDEASLNLRLSRISTTRTMLDVGYRFAVPATTVQENDSSR
jgi:hypothetical protein